MQRALWAPNCALDSLPVSRQLEKQSGRNRDVDSMLVLYRTRDQSIAVNELDGNCVATVSKVRGCDITLSVKCSSFKKPGELNTRTETLATGAWVMVGRTAKLSLIDIHGEKAQICVTAPKSTTVYRLA